MTTSKVTPIRAARRGTRATAYRIAYHALQKPLNEAFDGFFREFAVRYPNSTTGVLTQAYLNALRAHLEWREKAADTRQHAPEYQRLDYACAAGGDLCRGASSLKPGLVPGFFLPLSRGLRRCQNASVGRLR
jgi:hypothetical protein